MVCSHGDHHQSWGRQAQTFVSAYAATGSNPLLPANSSEEFLKFSRNTERDRKEETKKSLANEAEDDRETIFPN